MPIIHITLNPKCCTLDTPTNATKGQGPVVRTSGFPSNPLMIRVPLFLRVSEKATIGVPKP